MVAIKPPFCVSVCEVLEGKKQMPKKQPQLKLAGMFKLIVLGEEGVGKTSLLKRFVLKKDEAKQQLATVFPLSFATNYGEMSFNCWDPHSQPSDEFYMGAHAAIILFDVTSRISYKNVPIWFKDVVRVCENIPIVLCGNKVDCLGRTVKPKHILFHRKKNLPYFELSARANYNIEKPFLWIARKLTGDASLFLTEAPALVPPEVTVNAELVAANENALNAALPVDDDDL